MIEINYNNPEITLGEILSKHNLTISTAESCTAGGISNRIASVSGSSNYLVGGVVTYATDAKYNLINVSPNTVKNHNVVSPNVALEMATGVMKILDTDVSIGITGLAGPYDVDGIKSGTIYICVAIRTDKTLTLPDRFIIKNCNFNSTERSRNIEGAIKTALISAIEIINDNFLV